MQETDFLTFCNDEDTLVAKGLALYPQFYSEGNGYGDTNWQGTIEAQHDFPHLFFTMVGSQDFGVYMQTTLPTISIPNGSLVSIIGHEETYSVEAQVIMVAGNDIQVQIP